MKYLQRPLFWILGLVLSWTLVVTDVACGEVPTSATDGFVFASCTE